MNLMTQEDCPRCGGRAHYDVECYRWGRDSAWDVNMARRIVNQRPRELMRFTRADFEALPLCIWPERGVPERELNAPAPWVPVVGHLDHIPDEKLYEPPILITCTMTTRQGQVLGARLVLIDGTHRSAKRLRAGELSIGVYTLTREESYLCWLSGQSLIPLLPPIEKRAAL